MKFEQPSKHTCNDQEQLSRRQFLKNVGAVAGAAAATAGTGGLLHKALTAEGVQESSAQEQRHEQQSIGEDQWEGYVPDQELQEAIARIESMEEGESPLEQLRSGRDRVRLDEGAVQRMFMRWREYYQSNPELIQEAHSRMSMWYKEMSQHCKEHHVPEEFIQLSIVESNFQINAVAPHSGATGPYQFMKAMSAAYGFGAPTQDIDMRRDPGFSARGAAQHLRESYEAFNNDWLLAMADYNGGITNAFVRHHGRAPEDWEELLGYTEEHANKELSMCTTARERVDLYAKSKYRENVEYPLKFLALVAVLGDRMQEVHIFSKIPQPFYEVQAISRTYHGSIDFAHTVGTGETLIKVADRIIAFARERGLDMDAHSSLRIAEQIAAAHGITPEQLAVGTRITARINIPKVQRLEDIAPPFGCDQRIWHKLLYMLNPSFKRSTAEEIPIAMNYVRVPTEHCYEVAVRAAQKAQATQLVSKR